jgi:hypothetical protein
MYYLRDGLLFKLDFSFNSYPTHYNFPFLIKINSNSKYTFLIDINGDVWSINNTGYKQISDLSNIVDICTSVFPGQGGFCVNSQGEAFIIYSDMVEKIIFTDWPIPFIIKVLEHYIIDDSGYLYIRKTCNIYEKVHNIPLVKNIIIGTDTMILDIDNYVWKRTIDGTYIKIDLPKIKCITSYMFRFIFCDFDDNLYVLNRDKPIKKYSCLNIPNIACIELIHNSLLILDNGNKFYVYHEQDNKCECKPFLVDKLSNQQEIPIPIQIKSARKV